MVRRVIWRLAAFAGCALGLSLALAPSVSEAGPWVRAPGSVYSKVGATFFQADSSFNQGQDTGLEYQGQVYNLYLEAGLPYRLQAVADLPFVIGRNNSQQGVNYINRTLGDARFELAYGVFKDTPFTVAVEVKAPLYDTVASSESDTTFADYPTSRLSFPDAGDGNWDITPKIQAGYSFHPLPAWITGELGYRARLDGFADGIFATLGGGYFVWEQFIALGFFSNGVFNLEDDPNPELKATREFIYVQGYALFQAPELLPGLGLTVSTGGLPYSVNAAAGTDVGVGVSYAY